MKTLVILSAIVLTGCAGSQQLAQRHWDWLSANKGITPGYTTGVNISTITVNGAGYQVIAPAK